jgi:tyrosyl-tRNA synthetase
MGRELQRDYGQKPQIVLMTPILEGLDGVQKMSKSLNNAIGIDEPASEMYGKLMSISDELMWKYWVLLTDLRQSEVDALQAEVAAGTLHPMEAKKRLARTITAGFHGEGAALSADEDWARMFQQGGFSQNIEEFRFSLNDYLPENIVEREQMRLETTQTDFQEPAGSSQLLKIAKLLTDSGLASSNAEAQRKLKEGAVRINDQVWTKPTKPLESRDFTSPGKGSEVRLQIRLGKKAKLAIGS